jgi:hypothetical protein
MKKLIEFPLEDGGTILVQVDEPVPEGSVVKAARSDEITRKASQTFEKALDRIKPAATTLITKLRDLADPPDEIEVEFGLMLSADAGAFIAYAGAEANYTIKLTWKREEPKSRRPIRTVGWRMARRCW